jgi:hypothetical protein
MGELKDFLYSMIRNGDEFEAEKVSMQIGLGLCCASLSVWRKTLTNKEGGGA